MQLDVRRERKLRQVRGALWRVRIYRIESYVARVKESGKVIVHQHPDAHQHQNLTTSRGLTVAHSGVFKISVRRGEAPAIGVQGCSAVWWRWLGPLHGKILFCPQNEKFRYILMQF